MAVFPVWSGLSTKWVPSRYQSCIWDMDSQPCDLVKVASSLSTPVSSLVVGSLQRSSLSILPCHEHTCSLKSLQCRKGPVNATNIREITKILKFQRVFEGVFSGQGEVWIPIILSVSPTLLVYIDALSRYLPKEHGHWRDMNRDLNVGSITKSAMDVGK